MKKVIICLLPLVFGAQSLAEDICKVIPEAESKKDTLPVKYAKLKKENEKLRKALRECMDEKEFVRQDIADYKTKIENLKREKEELENRIREINEKLGGWR